MIQRDQMHWGSIAINGYRWKTIQGHVMLLCNKVQFSCLLQ